MLIQGGTEVSIVNCQVGNNSNLSLPYNTMQTRPLSGVYIGPGVGSTVFVGGMNGWIANSSYANANVNGNLQDYGIILGAGGIHIQLYHLWDSWIWEPPSEDRSTDGRRDWSDCVGGQLISLS
jgi:hypothetical protein